MSLVNQARARFQSLKLKKASMWPHPIICLIFSLSSQFRYASAYISDAVLLLTKLHRFIKENILFCILITRSVFMRENLEMKLM